MILSDLWWDKVDYILEFTAPIYDMLQVADVGFNDREGEGNNISTRRLGR